MAVILVVVALAAVISVTVIAVRRRRRPLSAAERYLRDVNALQLATHRRQNRQHNPRQAGNPYNGFDASGGAFMGGGGFGA